MCVEAAWNAVNSLSQLTHALEAEAKRLEFTRGGYGDETESAKLMQALETVEGLCAKVGTSVSHLIPKLKQKIVADLPAAAADPGSATSLVALDTKLLARVLSFGDLDSLLIARCSQKTRLLLASKQWRGEITARSQACRLWPWLGIGGGSGEFSCSAAAVLLQHPPPDLTTAEPQSQAAGPDAGALCTVVGLDMPPIGACPPPHCSPIKIRPSDPPTVCMRLQSGTGVPAPW